MPSLPTVVDSTLQL